MRRFLIVSAFLAIATFFISSCSSTTLPFRFDHFVDRVEANAPSYTDKDWEDIADQFNVLMEDYKKVYDKLDNDQRNQIDKAIGRYHALVLKSNVNGIINSFDKALEGLTNKAKDVLNGIGSFFEELGVGGE